MRHTSNHHEDSKVVRGVTLKVAVWKGRPNAAHAGSEWRAIATAEKNGDAFAASPVAYLDTYAQAMTWARSARTDLASAPEVQAKFNKGD